MSSSEGHPNVSAHALWMAVRREQLRRKVERSSQLAQERLSDQEAARRLAKRWARDGKL